MSELVLALRNGDPGSILDTGQQEELFLAQAPLSGTQRDVRTVQLLWDSHRGDAEPPEKRERETQISSGSGSSSRPLSWCLG